MAPPMDRGALHLRRLAALTLRRRVALGITDKRVAAARCSMSVTTYSNIEKGAPVSPTSYGKLEEGFGLLSGECERVLEGADSITLTDGTVLTANPQVTRSGEVSVDLSEELRRATMDVVTMVSPHVTGGEAQEISRRATEHALEVLRRRGLLPEPD